MINFEFETPTKYVFGQGVTERVATEAKAAGMRKPMIVFGKGSVVRSGLLDRVKNALDKEGIPYVLLGGVQPNPTDDKVYEGIALARSYDADSIIAVGGGSTIDTAKAIAAGVPYKGDFWDFFSGSPVTEALPVATILTIPAAGSEGSANMVITKLDGMKKVGTGSVVLRPRFSLLDPTLTFTLPQFQTAAGITDMMAHIMERYFSNTENVEVTDRISEGLLKAIMTEAPKVMTNPEDYDARANIMWSGTLAHNGLCGTGRLDDWATHGLEHELSALYGVTHGAGLAVMFPAWMTYASSLNPKKIAQFARRVFDVEEPDNMKAATLGIEKLKDFFRSIGMPTTMAELGVDNPDIERLAKKVTETKGNVFGNYIPVDYETAKKIYSIAQ